jgi:hypothetical protein
LCRAEHEDRRARSDELALFCHPAQHRAVVRRDDCGIAPVELCCLQCRFGHGGLRLQILQLLEADHFVGVQALAALEIALRFHVRLTSLFDLRIDFRLLDLRKLLPTANAIAFVDGDRLDHAAHLEREPKLIFIRE